MEICQYYADIYKDVRLATTTKVLGDGLDAGLKNLYTAVRAFLDKAKEYFDPENSGRCFNKSLAAVAC